MKPSVFILGARGSVPVSWPESLLHGGATSCIFIRMENQPVVLDAGTGILELPRVLNPDETDLPILLSHPPTPIIFWDCLCVLFSLTRKRLCTSTVLPETGSL